MLSIRKIGVLGRTYRHLARYRQILSVLLTHGFGNLLERLKIDQYIEVGLQVLTHRQPVAEERLSGAERLRLVLEELGPTYVKLGQVLSTRPDLVPVELVTELARLQDQVPPFAFADVQRIIAQELGGPVTSRFADIDETPLASASIGQVHRATLTDGAAVAVKVQRPGIERLIEVDLEIMLHLATLVQRHVEELALHQPVKIVEEFARTLEKELDYTIEAASMERVARHFFGDATLYVPKVHHAASSRRVLTTEYVEGIKVSQLEALDAAGLDRRLICRRGADILLRQIFDHGFFHADPHPGNIFVLPDNVICLVDFGMTGTVERAMREKFVELVDAVVRRDEVGTARAFLRLTEWDEEPEPGALERDTADFLDRHLYKPLKEIQIGRLLHHLLDLAARHRLRIAPDTFLMLKALSTVEGVARALDPEFDMIAACAPFIRQTLLARFSPQRLSEELGLFAADVAEFARQFPRDLGEIARRVRQQRLALRVELLGLDAVLASNDRSSNRVAFAIVIAALVIGSALIVIAEIPPLVYGISLIGFIGFLAAAIMGIWLLAAIVRQGRL
jgi:ubiquinone biosynthesis protein